MTEEKRMPAAASPQVVIPNKAATAQPISIVPNPATNASPQDAGDIPAPPPEDNE